MRCLVLLGLLLGAIAGCMSIGPVGDPLGPPVPLYCDNPLLMPVRDSSGLWEALTDVVDDYFRIETEEPVRVVGDTLTEGRLETFPEVGSTLLEPWRYDSADAYEKLESTLQSIRRTAHVRVIPSEGGFLVDVAVYKELEDVKRPAQASAGAATFRTEGSFTRVVSPIGEQEIHQGWIGLGRDRALEQRILAHLQERLGVQGLSPLPPAVPASQPSPQSSGPSCQPGSSSPRPSTPAPSPKCSVGSRDPDDAPREQRVFRLQMEEDAFEPWRQPSEGSGGTYGEEPVYQAPQSQAIEGEIEPLGPKALLGYEGVLDANALAGTSSMDEHAWEPIGARWRRTWRAELARLISDVKSDYGHFYSRESLALMAVGIGTASAIANTSADEHFQRWHDEHVFTHDVSRVAYVMREFGNGWRVLPLFAFCAIAQPEYEPDSVNWMVAEWGRRSLRSFLVGAPAVGVLQITLGGARPEENSPDSSHWTLFQMNGHALSGHAFIGGIAFMNAAEMTDFMPLKAALYAGSTLPAWSRVVQDKHYLSQVMLGWWFAYLSTRAVNLTDASRHSSVVLTPVVMENGGLGIGLLGSW